MRRPPEGGGQPPIRLGASPATPRPRFGLRRIVLLLVIALVGYLGVELYTPYHAWSSVERVDTDPGGARPSAGSGTTLLLVGSDSRDGLTRAERARLGTGGDPGKRTDSIILVHIPSGSGKSALISIPRDSFLAIPGHGKNKVNAAFAIGGPKLLVATLEEATDLRIDGYVEIGFDGFASVVDALDGVDICVKNAMNDKDAHINLAPGCQSLNGKNALGYVRARKSDPRGDIGRADRQRQFLGAVMKKALSPGLVLNPWRLWPFSHAAVDGLTVGEDTSILDAYRVVSAMRGISSGESLSLVVPIANPNATTSAGSSVLWDSGRSRQLFDMLRKGTPLESPPAGTDGKPTGS